MASSAAAPDACPGLRSGWRERRGGFQTLPCNAGRMPKRYPARRRRPELVVRAEPRFLHSLRSVEMTGSRDRVPACHEMSCFVMSGPFRPDHLIIQTGPYTMFFSHSIRLSGARQNAGPAAAALLLKGAGPGGNRPPKKFCSYNVPVRVSSSFLRRLRPGSGLRIPLLKGQGRARRERVRYSERPEGGIGARSSPSKTPSTTPRRARIRRSPTRRCGGMPGCGGIDHSGEGRPAYTVILAAAFRCIRDALFRFFRGRATASNAVGGRAYPSMST